VSRETSPDIKRKFLWLVGQNVSANAASVACGLSSRTGYRILNEAKNGGTNLSQQGGPFGDAPELPAHRPDPHWSTDQPVPAPKRLSYDPRYHGHTFRSFAAPLAFDGWDLRRVRSAISLHRQGNFLESTTLAMVLMGVAPIHAALKQRISPSLGLAKIVNGGLRGISRLVAEEVRAQMCPQNALMPSIYFPPSIWGGMAADVAMVGFSVLQHVMGEPDPDTGVQPVFTRRWPVWAVQYFRYRKTYVAVTSEGPVDIINDGKFTLVAHENEEPHFFGAINVLGEEGFDVKTTQRARSNYIDAYGNPKWVGIMPPNMAPKTPEGEAFEDAMEEAQQPDGTAVLPHGAAYKLEGLTSDRSTVMKDSLDSNWMFIAATLLGSDGTMTRGTGVYSAPIFAGVRRDLVADDLKASLVGANGGHVNVYCQFNYSSVRETKSWIQPVVDIPLPDPDTDARIKSYSDRVKIFHEVIEKEKSNGFEVTQERVEQLCEKLEIQAPQLAPADNQMRRIDLAPTDIAKVVKVKEARASQGLPPLGDERDDMTIAELDALSKPESESTSEPEKNGKGDEPAAGAAEPEAGANQNSSDVTGGGGTSTGGETKPATGAPAPEDP